MADIIPRISSDAGLTSETAATLLHKFGRNELAAETGRHPFLALLGFFASPLVIILLAAGSVSFFVGEPTNAVIIGVIVLLSVLLDFIQERRSGKTVEKLRATIAPRATVMRDGSPRVIDARELVPGDLVRLTVGDLVPADIRLLRVKDLFVDQAAFTGESFPVEKTVQPENAADPRLGTVFLGTTVTGGEGEGIVTATGGATEFAHLAGKLTATPPPTEFERGIAGFSALITKAVLGLVAFVFIVNLAVHRGTLESLLFAVALAVGLTPELLPMIVSVTLARGALRLSRQKVIVRRLGAIVNLGSLDIFCTDKTGTLTEGAITLERHVDLDGVPNDRVFLLALLNATLQTGLRSPLDEAILRHDHPQLPKFAKIEELPFDFQRRRLSVIVENEAGQRFLVTKGAPEAVLAVSTDYEKDGARLPFTEEARARFDKTFTALGEEGFRVLGIGIRELSSGKQSDFTNADERDLAFVGFAAFLDPPRASAGDTLAALRREGVEVKVLTGDNETVTAHICREVGLPLKGLITGTELEQVSDAALPAVALKNTVFARVSPDQKRRIIEALKRAGHGVGYLGDGINDAPSLRVADCGISVDGAVDVAREAADLVLLNKSLRVVLEGIREGRRTFGNIMKYVLMGTSSNFGNTFSMAGAAALLPFLPMLPSQILLNNLLYETAQITIPGDSVDREFLRKPKKWDISLIQGYMLWMGLLSSLFDFLTFGLLLFVFKADATLFRTGWFIESLATQTLVILVIRTQGAPWRSRPSRGLALSTAACVGVGIAIPFTPLAKWLGFTAPPPALLGAIGLILLVYLGLAEMVKRRVTARSS